MEHIKKIITEAKQEHLLRFYDQLTQEEQKLLEADIKDVDWNKIDQIKRTFMDSSGVFNPRPNVVISDNLLSPPPQDIVGSSSNCSQETIDKYHSIGLRGIASSNVAALVLAGGQGTRLGLDYPKGMLDVKLPSQKTLFQLQAERILKLESQASSGSIKWYIMTSPATHETTVCFFKEKNFFGLRKEDVVFFQQGTLPAFGFDGKIFLENKYKLSKSPDGNGGLFESLHSSQIIEHMKNNGIRYVHVYCVDNILVKVCDPTFMGFCIDKGAEAGSKVVEKVLPNEAVGIICKVDNKFKVIEYSEISDSIAQKRNETTGKLVFNAGNICEQFFTIDFLSSICKEREVPYHVAIKKIPHISLKNGSFIKPTETNGVKFEKFIFDFLEFTEKFVVWEVVREDEFSPIKNPDGSAKDNPRTAREALLRLCSMGKLDC